MVSRQSIERAQEWYSTGVNWIERDAVNLGISHLERAISVFEELGDAQAITRARHHRLNGLHKQKRYDEVETGFELVMQGYRQQEDSYGQALLLALLADSVARQSRWERALTHLNLAQAIAETAREAPLLAAICYRQSQLFLQQGDVEQAVRLLKRAEEKALEAGLEPEAAWMRTAQAQALTHLGERAEAIALLEDAQTRLMRLRCFRDALEPLKALEELYDFAKQWGDKGRVAELVHWCGQHVIQGPADKAPAFHGLPAVDRVTQPEIPEHTAPAATR